MAEDKWFKIINDDIDDIPVSVEKLKSKYWQKSLLFIILVVIGSILMGVGRSNGLVALGCFLAISGIGNILAEATMCHNQLCLYRLIKEIRASERFKSE